MTMPSTSIPKVQPFYMRLIIDAFDELMLHHDVCSFSFSELLTWIKGRVDSVAKSNQWLFCKTRRCANLQGDYEALKMNLGPRSDPLERAHVKVSRLYLNSLFGLLTKEIWCFSFQDKIGLRIEFYFELVGFPFWRWKYGRG